MEQGKTKRENGEGTLYFDESSKVYRSQVSYYTPDGKLKRKSFTGKTKSIVRERKNTFLREISFGNITSTSSCSVLDFINRGRSSRFSAQRYWKGRVHKTNGYNPCS